MLLSAEHIHLHFGTKQLLDDISLFLNDGDKIGIIGVNGTGKSSLLRILAGQLPADQGCITYSTNLQIAYLPQDPPMNDEDTVLSQVFSHFPQEFRALKEHEAKTILTQLGITAFSQKVGTLSGGQRKRVALATALICPADVMILDEPTNHLDADMVTWLEQWLMRYTGGLIMVTHDRYFLERVANRIIELSQCKLYSYEANYSKYLARKAARLEMAEASERKRQQLLKKEYAWISRGCKARTTKSKDRIDRYEALKNQSVPVQEESVQMAAISSRLGKKTITLDQVGKSYAEKTVLQPFSYQIQHKDRIGIVGGNGVGKSTLLQLISGQLAPTQGTIETGATVRIGYFTQENRSLDPTMRIHDFIHEIAREVHTQEGTFSAAQMLERFLFSKQVQYSTIGSLSGGERRRLYLLSVLMQAPNMLLLDEPTNDLDTTTLTILEDYLETFSGPILTVSHDRYFLDKLADSIWEVGKNGEITQYTGNYSDYLRKRPTQEPIKQTTAPKPAKPKAPAKPAKLRFSFKEQREFETIDDDIAALQAQLDACQQEIDANASDYLRLQALMQQHELLSAQLEEKTERWVYLNDLAEQIARQS